MAKRQTAQNTNINNIDAPKLFFLKIIIQPETTKTEFGVVITMADGVAIVGGLPNVKVGELVTLSNVKGLALNLNKDTVGIAIFGDDNKVFEGDIVKRTNKIIKIPVGPKLQGRILNALGEYIDSGVQLTEFKDIPYSIIEVKAPEIIDRQSVNEPLQTRILSIDSMIPIGRGQRELIIGDRQTGKTSIAIDTIINQKQKSEYHASKQIFCIYVAVGQKRSTVARLSERLRVEGALIYTTIVATTASESAVLQYLAPYTGAAIGEFYTHRGYRLFLLINNYIRYYINARLPLSDFMFCYLLIQIVKFNNNHHSYIDAIKNVNNLSKSLILNKLNNDLKLFKNDKKKFLFVVFENIIKNAFLNWVTWNHYSIIKFIFSFVAYIDHIKFYKNKNNLVPFMLLGGLVINLFNDDKQKIEKSINLLNGRANVSRNQLTSQILLRMKLVLTRYSKCNSLGMHFSKNNRPALLAFSKKTFPSVKLNTKYSLQQVNSLSYRQVVKTYTDGHPLAILNTNDGDNCFYGKFTQKPLLEEKHRAIILPSLTKDYLGQQKFVPDSSTTINCSLTPIEDEFLNTKSQLDIIGRKSLTSILNHVEEIASLTDSDILLSTKDFNFEFNNVQQVEAHITFLENNGGIDEIIHSFTKL